MAEAVILGDIELDSISAISISEQRKLARHAVPGWDGDLVQDLGAAAVRIELEGLDFAQGDTALGQRLESLRALAAAGEPIDFTASAAAASAVEQVLIESLDVRQSGVGQHAYAYRLRCLQYVEPPPPQIGGFDAGLLDDIAGAADLAALADAASLVDDLGNIAAQGAAFAEEALTVIDDLKDLVEGAIELEPLVSAAGNILSLGSWFD